MVEYIKREEILNEQVEICYWDGLNDSYGDFVPVETIRSISAADVVEIIHGEWKDGVFVNNKFPSVRCSECNIRFCDIINNHRSMWHYCPHCGAKMDGKTHITFNNQENVKENTKNIKAKVRLRRTDSRNNT